MHGADLIVVVVAALVEAAQSCRKRLPEKSRIDLRHSPLESHRAGHVDRIEKPPGVSVGQFDHDTACILRHRELRKLSLKRTLKKDFGLLGLETLKLIHSRTAQKSRIHLKAGIFGRRADKDEESRLHMRQKGVLLALAESMDLIHKKKSWPAGETHRFLCGINCVTDFLHAAEYGGDRDEGEVKCRCHQAGKRGLADAGRPPEDHRMRAMLFECGAKRRSRSQQVSLPHDFVEGSRSHAFGQRPQHGLRLLG